MTTKVQICVVQKHMPVIVEIVGSDGIVRYTQRLIGPESLAASEYVHSGQTLRVREMTTEEQMAVDYAV